MFHHIPEWKKHYEAAKALTRPQLEQAVIRDRENSRFVGHRFDAYQTALREKIAVEEAALELAMREA